MGEFVADIWGWDQGWQRSDFNKHFEPENITVVLAGNELVGYCQVEDQGQELFVRMLLLLPEYQERGIGTRLINAVIESAKAQSKNVSLQVFKVNKRARRFYERRGFRVTGTTARYATMKWDSSQ
jgi:ribosomal protein S18 acetylase RimI-like enzyme